MKTMEVADTVFRAYRKKTGNTALHLRSYLIVSTDKPFPLAACLRDVRCWITLPGEEERECDAVAVGETPVCEYDGRCLLHDLWVSTLIPRPYKLVKNCVADLRVLYQISFPGRPARKPVLIRRKVPVVTFQRETGGISGPQRNVRLFHSRTRQLTMLE